DRQLGEGGSASAGTPRTRPDGTEPDTVLGDQCHGAGRHRLSPYVAPSAPCHARRGVGQVSGAIASSAVSNGHRTIAVGALAATYLQAVTISLPNAALLHIQGTLSMSDDEVGWIFTSYLAASAVTMPVAGWLAGRYGRKAVYQLSIGIFAAGLLLVTFAT